jgi:hypothetical protein
MSPSSCPPAEGNQPSFLLGSRRNLPGVIVTTRIVIDEVANGLPGAELAPRASAQKQALRDLLPDRSGAQIGRTV